MQAGNLSHGCVSKIGQKPAPMPGLAEVKREFYIRRLAVIAIAAVVIGTIILLLWSALTARFDERYALELLARHDPGVLATSFEQMRTEEGFELFSSDLLIANGTFAGRDATISTALEGNESKVVSSDALWFGLATPNIGRVTRRWACPEGTWFNMSVEETGRHLYVGADGNWLMLSSWRQKVAELGWTDEAIAAAAAAANVNGASLGAMAEAVKSGRVAMVWYFSPDERGAYEAKKAELVALAADCEEVAA